MEKEKPGGCGVVLGPGIPSDKWNILAKEQNRE